MWAIGRRTAFFVVSYAPLAAMFVALKWPTGWDASAIARLGAWISAIAVLIVVPAALTLSSGFATKAGTVLAAGLGIGVLTLGVVAGWCEPMVLHPHKPRTSAAATGIAFLLLVLALLITGLIVYNARRAGEAHWTITDPRDQGGAVAGLAIDPDVLVLASEANGDGVVTQKEQAAVLVELVQRADELPEIGAGQLISRLDGDQLYLQAICIRTAEGNVGFVTKTVKRPLLKRSALPLGKDDANDRFKRVARPELVLEPDVHAVVSPTAIAVLNKYKFELMVSDVGLVLSYAPTYVKRIADRLSDRNIVMAETTLKALETKARSNIPMARRLDAFLERIDQVDVSRIVNGVGFEAQDLNKNDFVNASGEIECQPDRVAHLLDALEGRFFGDAFTDEKRRADRFRRRR